MKYFFLWAKDEGADVKDNLLFILSGLYCCMICEELSQILQSYQCLVLNIIKKL